MGQRFILIVEDEPVWDKLLRRLFSECGNKVELTGACAGALAILETTRPDCVICDFNLPDGDAREICARIRARYGLKVPVLIFSSDPIAEICLSEKYGADMFLLKSEPLEKLLSAVNELLAASRPA